MENHILNSTKDQIFNAESVVRATRKDLFKSFEKLCKENGWPLIYYPEYKEMKRKALE